MTFRLVEDKLAVDGKLKRLRVRIEEKRDKFLQAMATKIVLDSPVDTGTYVKAHEIIQGRASGLRNQSSTGKPRKQPYEPNYNEALAKLFQQIEAIPLEAKLISVRNNAVHAGSVEDAHDVYARARVESRNIARSVMNA